MSLIRKGAIIENFPSPLATELIRAHIAAKVINYGEILCHGKGKR
jgi:hypothetical protein